MAVTLHKQANCGFVMLNSPPVNAINQKMREAQEKISEAKMTKSTHFSTTLQGLI